MTNLPITSSAPQAAASAKKTATNAAAGDAQDTQPFGDVLARQISDPTTKDVKADGKLADALAKLGTDIKAGKKEGTDDKQQPDVATPDTPPTLPTDMLAALLPQAATAATTTAPPVTDAKSDAATTIGTQPIRDKIGGSMPKAEAKASVDVQSATPKQPTGANPDVQPREPVFAAALASQANRPASANGTELSSAVREAVTVAAQQVSTAPQSNAAALASLQNTAANVAAPALQPVKVTVDTPVNQPKWSDDFSQKITWLASSNKDQTAELHLNPPQLGPVDVVIKVSGDQATALFTSPHAAVRDAIEQAMPRLRDMMADNGIMLGNATVSDQTPRDQGQSGTQQAPSPAVSRIQDTTAVGNSAVRVSPISRHNGIVDTFA